jgi:Ser/Thr protein kinase RdoA (MazF antagonist)
MAWERFFTEQMLLRARRRFADELPSTFERAIEVCIRQRKPLEELWAGGDRTLVHGDCHIGNLFFEGKEVGFFDWQVASCAPGMRDVSYFLSNSLPSELRGAHERELITRYLEGLAAGGARAPGWNEAWRQHRLYALYTFLAAVFTAGAGERLQPRKVALAGVRRGTRAVAELETLALLEKEG